jgi:hypothetical protein
MRRPRRRRPDLLVRSRLPIAAFSGSAAAASYRRAFKPSTVGITPGMHFVSIASSSHGFDDRSGSMIDFPAKSK